MTEVVSLVLQAIAASVSSHVDQAGPEETVTAELAAILYPDEEPPANLAKFEDSYCPEQRRLG